MKEENEEYKVSKLTEAVRIARNIDFEETNFLIKKLCEKGSGDFLGSNLRDRGAIKIADILKRSTNLKSLDLRHNKITDLGARKIAISLKKNSTLEQLWLVFSLGQIF